MKQIICTMIISALLILPVTSTYGAGTLASESDFEVSQGEDGSSTITRYLGSAEDLVIPDVLGGFPVKRIAEYAFINNHNLKRVTFPDSLASIGERAFVGCLALERLHLPAGVASIGNSAFLLTNLSEISVDAYNTVYRQIDGVLFERVHSILHTYPAAKKEVVYQIPPGTLGIEIGAFQHCANLKEASIPDTVTFIGIRAFSGCAALSSMYIPAGVISIGTGAFQGTNLTGFAVAEENPVYWSWDGVLFDRVNNTLHTFPTQKAAREYRIPPGTQGIAHYAFAECAKVEHVVYPDGMKGTGYSAFYYNTGLTRVTLPDSIQTIDTYSFYNCMNLKSITLPAHITSIGYCAFAGCTSLTDVNVPDSVTTIEGSAFYDCINLKRLVIPDSVIIIGDDAFKNCTKLILEVNAGSFAQRYVLDKGLPYKLL